MAVLLLGVVGCAAPAPSKFITAAQTACSLPDLKPDFDACVTIAAISLDAADRPAPTPRARLENVYDALHQYSPYGLTTRGLSPGRKPWEPGLRSQADGVMRSLQLVEAIDSLSGLTPTQSEITSAIGAGLRSTTD